MPGLKKATSPLKERLFKRKNKGQKKDNASLKSISKKNRKKEKRKRQKTIFFGLSIVILAFGLLFFGIVYMLSPEYTLRARIKVIRGGYELVYDVSSIDVDRFNKLPEIGDTIYVDEFGNPTISPRHAIRMRVVDIENDTVHTEFAINNVPLFISTSDLQNIVKKTDNGRIYSHVNVAGKIIGSSFKMHSISFDRSL